MRLSRLIAGALILLCIAGATSIPPRSAHAQADLRQAYVNSRDAHLGQFNDLLGRLRSDEEAHRGMLPYLLAQLRVLWMAILMENQLIGVIDGANPQGIIASCPVGAFGRFTVGDNRQIRSAESKGTLLFGKHPEGEAYRAAVAIFAVNVCYSLMHDLASGDTDDLALHRQAGLYLSGQMMLEPAERDSPEKLQKAIRLLLQP